ncbi:hypothetical protein SAMN05216325_11065 [Nitrosomonas marina]|uniref:Uncharacterized protein n=1 Tax=Nitrosomonas marina TaxID=917 RepID=A0A1H8EPI1_9PROT|nr:hypothetical protein SAMN05216325_11065 [Nitrosomonas marina]
MQNMTHSRIYNKPRESPHVLTVLIAEITPLKNRLVTSPDSDKHTISGIYLPDSGWRIPVREKL